MPIITEFEYEKVKTLKEALELKYSYGENGKILAGGTDLIVLLKENVVAPQLLIDMKNIEELSKIFIKNNSIIIGANVTFSKIIKSKEIKKYFPVLWEAAMTVASVGIRNRATIAGNICSAVPCADSAPPLLIYEADINLLSKDGERKVSIHNWFKGPKKTDIKPDEILYSIELKLPDYKEAGAYLKLSRYNGEDLAQAALAVLMDEDKNYKIAFGALSSTPKRAYKIEEYLKGKKIDEKTIEEAIKKIDNEISPITDIRATKEYRFYMAKVMFKRAIEKTLDRFYKGKPPYGEGMIE